MNAVSPRDDRISSEFGGQPNTVLGVEAGEPVVVPGGGWFLRGDFGRDGGDLVLTGRDGSEARVAGYFDLDTPPALRSEGGAVLSGDLVTRLSKTVQLAQTQTAATDVSDSIGQIETAQGTVEAVHVDGTRVTLAPGDPVYQGDVIITGDSGAVGIVFADNSTFSLDANGEMKLDEMVYDPGAQEGSLSVGIVQGVFTFVSGQIAKTGPDSMTITTPVATIGIRGTTGAGTAAPEGQPNDIVLLPEANGDSGEMTVTTQGGTQTINQPFQGATMTSAFQAPAQQTFTQDQVNSNFGGALNTLQAAQQSFQQRTAGDAGEGEGEGGDGEGDGDGDAPPEGEGDGEAEGDAPPEGEGEGEAPPEGEGDLAEGDPEGEGGLEGDAGLEGEGDGGPEGDAGPEGDGGEQIADGAGDAGLPDDGPGDAGDGPIGADDGGPIGGDGGDPIGGNADTGLAGGDGVATGGTGGPIGGGSIFGGGGILDGSNDDGWTDFGTDFGGDGGGGDDSGGDDFVFVPAPPPTPITTPEPTDDTVIVDLDPESEFQEVLIATTGNDSLVGGAENTEFVMEQAGTRDPVPSGTLGGIDTVDGGAGINQLTFDFLHEVTGMLDSAAGVLTLWNWTSEGDAGPDDPAAIVAAADAQVTVSNIQQLFFGSYDGVGIEQFTDFEIGASFDGMIVAGGTGNDEINWDDKNSNAIAESGEFNGWFAGADGVLVFGGGGDDVIYGSGFGDILHGGAGNDQIFGYDGENTIIAGDGDDFVQGGAGNDTIIGGAGDDILSGGGDGVDEIYGGSGGDVIAIIDGADSQIIDGGGGTDILDYGLVFGTVSSAVSINFVAGATETDAASPLFDLDVVHATRDGGTITDAFRGIEAVGGSAQADTFSFTGDHTGGDLLEVDGGDGNDIFEVGDDVTATLVTAGLVGGAGDDVFYVATNATITGVIDGGQDFDEVYLDNGGAVSVSNVEYVEGNGGADQVTFVAATTGADIDLGAGTDSLMLANGTNAVLVTDVETVTGGTGTDTVTLAGFVNTVTISGVENVIGGTGQDIVTFGSAITGTVVDLAGAADNDMLNLADGTNSVTVDNVEKIYGGTGADTVMLGTVPGSLFVDLGAGDDTLGIAANSLGGTLNGGAGTADTLALTSGGTLADSQFAGVSGFETLALADAGYDITLGANALAAFGGSGITIDGTAVTTEDGVFLDAAAFSGAVTIDLSNSIGMNTLTGGSGDDTFLAGGGSDTIFGGDGADIINLGLADGASDLVRYTAATEGGAGGANTGYDVISDFAVEEDTIEIAGDLAAAIDEFGVGLVWILDGYADFTSQSVVGATKVSGLADAWLTESGFTNLVSALNTNGVASNNGDTGLILVNGAANSAIFVFEENGNAANNVTVDELTLLGVVQGTVVDYTDITLDNPMQGMA